MSIQSRSIRQPTFSSAFYQNIKSLEQIRPFHQEEDKPKPRGPSEREIAKRKLLKLLGRKRKHKEIACEPANSQNT